MTDDLKKLPPEERIKRLKELEKKRKQEIIKAQEQIKQSEDELLTEMQQKDLELLSVMEKIDKDKSDEKDIPPEPIDDIALEERLRQEREQSFPQSGNPVYALSKEPMQDLYQEMSNIYRAMENKGYLRSDEVRKVDNLASAVEEKIKANNEGTYSFTEKVAQAADITQRIGSKLKNMYHS